MSGIRALAAHVIKSLVYLKEIRTRECYDSIGNDALTY